MRLHKFNFVALILVISCITSCLDNVYSQQSNAQIEVIAPVSNDDQKFNILVEKMRKLQGNTQKNWDNYEQGARDLIKQFPEQPDGYQFLINEILFGKREKALALAKELSGMSAPEKYRLWAKGFIFRHDSIGKPVMMQFTSLDGREVDLAKLKGKVVLVDFWGTACVPCVAALPTIKTAYDKYHQQGFEVIGISYDSDKARLTRFVKEHEYPWPQSFEGEQGVDNRFAQEFGVCGIPHMLLLDKKGFLRNGDFHTGPTFEASITELLNE
jgi:thiol-disulfide isomerase/thioredoxin